MTFPEAQPPLCGGGEAQGTQGPELRVLDSPKRELSFLVPSWVSGQKQEKPLGARAHSGAAGSRHCRDPRNPGSGPEEEKPLTTGCSRTARVPRPAPWSLKLGTPQPHPSLWTCRNHFCGSAVNGHSGSKSFTADSADKFNTSRVRRKRRSGQASTGGSIFPQESSPDRGSRSSLRKEPGDTVGQQPLNSLALMLRRQTTFNCEPRVVCANGNTPSLEVGDAHSVPEQKS